MKYPDNLKHYRKTLGLNQSTVAKRVRIHQSAYSRIENGAQTMTRRQAMRLAKLYGVHPGELLFPDWPRVVK